MPKTMKIRVVEAASGAFASETKTTLDADAAQRRGGSRGLSPNPYPIRLLASHCSPLLSLAAADAPRPCGPTLLVQSPCRLPQRQCPRRAPTRRLRLGKSEEAEMTRAHSLAPRATAGCIHKEWRAPNRKRIHFRRVQVPGG